MTTMDVTPALSGLLTFITKNENTAMLSLFTNTIFRSTGLRPIYVMFFKLLPISFQMKNNDDMWL